MVPTLPTILGKIMWTPWQHTLCPHEFWPGLYLHVRAYLFVLECNIPLSLTNNVNNKPFVFEHFPHFLHHHIIFYFIYLIMYIYIYDMIIYRPGLCTFTCWNWWSKACVNKVFTYQVFDWSFKQISDHDA